MAEINDAIDSATEYILENEVPICDYTCAPQNLGKIMKSQSVRVTTKRNIQKLKTVIRRLSIISETRKDNVKQTIAQTIAKSIRAEKRKTIVQLKFQSQFMQNFQRHYPGIIDNTAQINGYKKALSKKKSTIDSEKSSINLPMKTSFVLGN